MILLLGISAGLYGSFAFKTTGNSSTLEFSYEIDQGPPINFTLENPFSNPSVIAAMTPQLLLQTPPLSPGPHTLRLTVLKSSDGLISILGRQFIVQNTTRLVQLEAVPSIPNSSMISNPVLDVVRKGHRTNEAVIAGAAVSAFVILFIGLWAWLKWRKKGRVSILDQRRVSQPFDIPDHHPSGRFRLSQYTTRTKTNKYREAFSSISLELNQPIQWEHGQGGTTIDVPQSDEEHRIRYRCHEDGGELHDAEVQHGNNNEDEVISLPPMYSTLRRSSSSSIPSAVTSPSRIPEEAIVNTHV